MEENFKIGDLVRLKSGGPLMTISSATKTTSFNGGPSKFTGKFKCTWFDAKNEPQFQEFHQDTLESDED